MKTTVVNLRNHPFDVYIGRGSMWGNPYSHKENTKALYVVSTRKEAIEKYKEYILTKPELIKLAKTELKGKVLGCYCKPKSCHGDILIELIHSTAIGFEF